MRHERPPSPPPEQVEVVWPDTAELDPEVALLADAQALVDAGLVTDDSYRTLVHRHLVPAFGRMKLAEISVERIEAYLRSKRDAGLAPTSLHRHLVCLGLIFKSAERRGLVQRNVIPLVERPRAPRPRSRILTPVEIQAAKRAWNDLIEEATPGDHRDDLTVGRALFTTLIHTGIRRGEALGLRWKHVHLADPTSPWLRIEETFTRAAADTPKSEAGSRTISLGPVIASALPRQPLTAGSG